MHAPCHCRIGSLAHLCSCILLVLNQYFQKRVRMCYFYNSYPAPPSPPPPPPPFLPLHSTPPRRGFASSQQKQQHQQHPPPPHRQKKKQKKNNQPTNQPNEQTNLKNTWVEQRMANVPEGCRIFWDGPPKAMRTVNNDAMFFDGTRDCRAKA